MSDELPADDRAAYEGARQALSDWIRTNVRPDADLAEADRLLRAYAAAIGRMAMSAALATLAKGDAPQN